MESSISRRDLLAGAAVGPLARAPQQPGARSATSTRLKVVFTGGHPGDPECGCAGTIARYSDIGCQVTIVYLNRGDAYCGTDELKHCATIRTAEAEKACQILKARPVFAGQYDGRAVIDNTHYEEFQKVLEGETPDLVFTQWPIDQHRDHRAVSALTLDAWLKGGKKFALYYYEVADDTMMFAPTEYVDISAVEDRRRAACFAHSSQGPEKWYAAQTEITRFRGVESGHPQAEAFLKHPQSQRGLLP
jgi:LmbE family N-acetylglucosaminyl deacetylase